MLITDLNINSISFINSIYVVGTVQGSDDTEVSKTNNFCSHGASKTNISNTDKYKEENILG